MKALVKLSGPNRKVWFLSEDGVNITHIRDNQEIYSLGTSKSTDDDTEDVDAGSVVLILDNDKIYNISKNTTSVTLIGSDDFKYCTISLTTGSSGISFMVPAEWRCTGADCTDLKFSPAANSEYNIAIDTIADKTTLYILKIE